MKYAASVVLGACLAFSAHAQSNIVITSFSSNGELNWVGPVSNVQTFTVEWAASLDGPWTNNWSGLTGIVNTQASYTVSVPMFYRIVGVPRRIFGTTIHDWQPIAGVELRLGLTNDVNVYFASTLSDTNGAYSFDDVPINVECWLWVNDPADQAGSYSGFPISPQEQMPFNPGVMRNIDPIYPINFEEAPISPEFSWQGLPSADNYTFILYGTGAQVNDEIERVTGITGTTYTTSLSLTPGSNYSWRVRGYNEWEEEVGNSPPSREWFVIATP